MRKLIPSFLSHDWAGLPIALVIGLAGGACLHAGWQRSGYGLLGVGIVLAIGSLYHLAYMARVRAACPPPGKLIDIGGYRLHVLAEGRATTLPTVVWIPGAHAGGLALHHLHRALREETRSILIDRAGTGWSDAGPFPRSTAQEADEVISALLRSGETGPYVLVGHSFGGLLVANIARRRPELACGLVLLDATHFDFFNYAPPQIRPTIMMTLGNLNGMLHLFGLHADAAEVLGRLRSDVRQTLDLIKRHLGEATSMGFKKIELSSRPGFSSASILSELSIEGCARAGFDALVHDGELGALPVFVVTPSDASEMRPADRAAALRLRKSTGLDEAGFERYMEVVTAVRRRYLATSSRSEHVFAPAGAGHNFPYEAPEFVAQVVSRMLHTAARAG
jgi:pimeloyl-ACP methyl ester carboxylesterase